MDDLDAYARQEAERQREYFEKQRQAEIERQRYLDEERQRQEQQRPEQERRQQEERQAYWRQQQEQEERQRQYEAQQREQFQRQYEAQQNEMRRRQEEIDRNHRESYYNGHSYQQQEESSRFWRGSQTQRAQYNAYSGRTPRTFDIRPEEYMQIMRKKRELAQYLLDQKKKEEDEEYEVNLLSLWILGLIILAIKIIPGGFLLRYFPLLGYLWVLFFGLSFIVKYVDMAFPFITKNIFTSGIKKYMVNIPIWLGYSLLLPSCLYAYYLTDTDPKYIMDSAFELLQITSVTLTITLLCNMICLCFMGPQNKPKWYCTHRWLAGWLIIVFGIVIGIMYGVNANRGYFPSFRSEVRSVVVSTSQLPYIGKFILVHQEKRTTKNKK